LHGHACWHHQQFFSIFSFGPGLCYLSVLAFDTDLLASLVVVQQINRNFYSRLPPFSPPSSMFFVWAVLFRVYPLNYPPFALCNNQPRPSVSSSLMAAPCVLVAVLSGFSVHAFFSSAFPSSTINDRRCNGVHRHRHRIWSSHSLELQPVRYGAPSPTYRTLTALTIAWRAQ